jgi:acyl-CoA reductase-like NAD-dependent aldehyde dehydrogenase
MLYTIPEGEPDIAMLYMTPEPIQLRGRLPNKRVERATRWKAARSRAPPKAWPHLVFAQRTSWLLRLAERLRLRRLAN